jgi:hypothetical protein
MAQTAPRKLLSEKDLEAEYNRRIPLSAVLISTKITPQSSTFGTGFVVVNEGKHPGCRLNPRDPSDTDEVRTFLVTNRHVLPPEDFDSHIGIARGPTEEGGNKTAAIRTRIDLVDAKGNFLPSVKFHPKGYDIAVIELTALESFEYIRALPTEILAREGHPPEGVRASSMAMGDEIYILGFPDAIHDARNAYPILRGGAISTLPDVGFSFSETMRQRFGLPQQLDGFLIDAAIFPGSSGSLVVRRRINYEDVEYVVGIVSDSLPIKDFQLKTEQRMGLAVVYSADAICDTINEFFK